MSQTIELGIIILIILLVFFWFRPQERFGPSFYQASTENNMDYIKDNKGYTLDDYILEDNMLYGKPIKSPF